MEQYFELLYIWAYIITYIAGHGGWLPFLLCPTWAFHLSIRVQTGLIEEALPCL